ncbi:MAG: septal ring lytic transglycosylase RlpA family protein [Polaromonas sp.]
MTLPVFTAQGVLKRWFAVSVLILMAGCTTLPRPDPAAALSSSESSPQALATPSAAPPSPAKSSFSDFIARHLHKKAVTPISAVEAEEKLISEVPVDEKYQLTGKAARELERGNASWYGGQFQGRRTASGERFDKYALTAAHKTLPFGTIVLVRSERLGREVEVRINDRGPFAPGRVIDLSQAAAEALGLTGSGVGEVTLHVAADLDESVFSSRSGKKSRLASTLSR